MQEILSKYPPRPVGENQTVRNPLAGLVVCSVCGRTMIRRYSKHDKGLWLHCNTPKCPNVSSSVELVEARILSSLRNWLNEYRLQWELSGSKASVSRAEIGKQALAKLRAELLRLEKQLDKTHDLLEQGVYDTETFLSRSRLLAKQISSVKEQIATVENSIVAEEVRAKCAVGIVPKVEYLLSVYSSLPSPLLKNNMLKDVLEKVVYIKTKNGHLKGASPDDFEITIYPKIPHSSTPGSE